MNNITFGKCPICGQGQLVPMKKLSDGNLLIMCDDCESQWHNPEEAQSYKEVMVEEVDEIVDASEEDIEAIGWRKHLKAY